MIAPLLAITLTGALGLWLLWQGLEEARRERAATEQPSLGMRLHQALERWLAQAGYAGLAPHRLLLLSLGAGLAGALLGWLALGWVAAAGVAGVAGLLLPAVAVSWRRERRRSSLHDGVVEVIARLRDAIRAGSAIPEALGALATTGPVDLRPELGALARDLRLSGFQPALSRFRERMADSTVDLLVSSLLLNDRLGGRGISDVLDRLAHAVQAESLVTAELRAYQARNRTTARVVAAVPVVVLVAIRLLSPRYAASFDTPVGQGLLLVCAGMIAVGYAGMRYLSRVPGEGRWT